MVQGDEEEGLAEEPGRGGQTAMRPEHQPGVSLGSAGEGGEERKSS